MRLPLASHQRARPAALSPTTQMEINLYLIMLTIGAVLVLVSIDMNIIATAVPTITDQFHTVADVGWYSSGFRLCVCAFQFMFGKAYGLFPVKRAFLLANAILMAGSLLSATAVASRMLVVGRAVAGMGSAGLLAGCFITCTRKIPVHQRPMFAGLLAPLIGGALTQSLGWRW